MRTVDIIKNFFKAYNKYNLPPIESNRSHKVDIKVVIKSIFDISEQSSSFTVKYLLFQFWQDTRLQFIPFIENHKMIYDIVIPADLFQQKGMNPN